MRLYIYDRALHPELFEIHHERRISADHYQATIWVTKCSHVIGFFRDDAAMLEVTANDTGILPQRGMVADMPLRGEHEFQHNQPDAISYMMNFQVEKMSAAVFSATHADIAAQRRKRGIYVPFDPSSSEQLNPFSYISYVARSHELQVFTYHAIPESFAFIRTQSVFELA